MNSEAGSALVHLTVKPLLRCASRCPYCRGRQATFKHGSGSHLTIDDWARVFAEADALGVRYLDISGGEPTLYSHLPALVWEAKRLGWFVNVNTSGAGWTPELRQHLVATHLDQVILSIMGARRELHDGLRGVPGSWDRAMAAARDLSRSDIRLSLHFIVTRRNLADLPAVVELAFDLGACSLALVYPEDDHETHAYLPRPDDMTSLAQRVLPQTLETYKCKLAEAGRCAGEHDIATLSGLYRQEAGRDWTAGEFWEEAAETRSACAKPDFFMLIYADGRVLPCNGMEYTGEPVAGDARAEPLKEIWEGPAYAAFRQARSPFCRHCPSPLHRGISITTSFNPPYTAPAIKQVPPGLPPQRPL